MRFCRKLSHIGGLRPRDVTKPSDDVKVRKLIGFKPVPWRLQKKRQKTRSDNTLPQGCFVFVSLVKGKSGNFQRGFKISDKSYAIIKKVDQVRRPVVYTLQDLNLRTIPGGYYRDGRAEITFSFELQLQTYFVYRPTVILSRLVYVRRCILAACPADLRQSNQ